jgi:uncharacterized protein
MVANSSAGVYVQEIDNSQVASQVSTSVAAIIGESNRGPVNQRVLVTSTQRFIEQFGVPNAELGYMHHSALAFLNEANRLYVTRVAPGALFGGATVYIGSTALNEMYAWDTGVETPSEYDFMNDDLFVVYAADPGAWNNDISVRIYPNTRIDDNTFYVDVFEGSSGVASESFLVHMNLQIDGYGAQQNVMQLINKRSKLIRIEQNYAQAQWVQNPKKKFISSLTQVTLAGGYNGERATTGQFMQAWELYRNPEDISINILINGGLTAPALQARMDEICQDRMDCFAILDTPSADQKVQDAINYRRSSLAVNSSYSALYSCDLYVLDSYSSRRLYVPPSGYVAAAFAKTDRDFATWFAPAGLVRGKLTVLGVRHQYNQGDRDAMVESQVNPIRVIEGIGVSIWGADTLQTMRSALTNVNVRRLMMYLEKSLSETALYSVFNPNDEIMRARLVEVGERFLRGIQEGRGVYRFGVTCDDSNNPPETVAAGDLFWDVFIDPVLPAKRILLQATINKTGARFTTANAA